MNGTSLIFILGLSSRSGTHMIQDILSCHPAILPPSFVQEDYVVENLYKLEGFITAVQGNLDKKKLRHHLGGGLEKSLSFGNTLWYTTCRTPSPKGIHLLDEYLPRARVVVITRDGRDAIESGMISFGKTIEYQTQLWKKKAEYWLSHKHMLEDKIKENRADIIRYEDFLETNRRYLSSRNLFTQLGFKPEEVDWVKFSKLGIRGSSDLVREGKHLHWKSVPKQDNFNPVGRWKTTWDKDKIDYFNYIAGHLNKQLGYGE